MQSKIVNKYKAYDDEKEFATGEQDQEQGPWFTASGLGGAVAAKRRLFHEKIKNLTKPKP